MFNNDPSLYTFEVYVNGTPPTHTKTKKENKENENPGKEGKEKEMMDGPELDKLKRICALASEHFSDYHIAVRFKDGNTVQKISCESWSYGTMSRWCQEIEHTNRMNVESELEGGH